MTQQELKHILSSKFDFEKWKELLGMMFLKIDYLSKPIQIEDKAVKRGGQIGAIRLDDGRSLGLLVFEVADNVIIARKRKGLRDIPIDIIDQDVFHGALAFYYSQSQTDYRLTFVSKQTIINAEGTLETKSTAPKRYTFLLGTNEPCTTAANRLLELINKKKSGSVYLADVTEAFSVERLNKDFFKGYKDQYFKFLGLIGKESKENRDYVKKLLGRLVFLQFLQKKGWMGVPASNKNWDGGDKNYLFNLIQKYEGNDRLLSDVLEVLFFNTLNEKRPDDIADPILGDNIKIPYLNGGLFDKDDLDKKDIDFPYPYFEELMEFFGMYNFTIDENDPDDAEVGVDPEMLGHIFENLLEDNKDKGAFYTPKEIVQYMSEESIAQYLKTHTEEALHPAIDELIKQKTVGEILQNKTSATVVYKLLKEVKVCDPAIGSGAFPMGVLNVLYHSRLLLYGFTKPTQDFSPANVKREIIQNNIYGVDIEQGAVDIARLRFWLALVVDEIQPEPLPNLDFKIMQGNSLLEQYGDIDLSRLSDAAWNIKIVQPQADLFGHIDDAQLKMTFSSETHTQDVQRKITRYFSIDDHKEKASLFQGIEEDVRQNILYNIDMRLQQAERIVEELKSYPSLNKTQVKEKAEKEEAVIRYKEMMDEVRMMSFPNNKFFLWHTYFKDVFDNGGFDIVIGNPPYVQLQCNDGLLAKMYEKCRYECFAKTGDIYCLFYERGWQLLKKNGHLCYITSNKWMRAAYGEKTRDFFASKTNPMLLVDFAGVKIFESATVDTNILLFAKSNNQHKTVCAVTNKQNKDGINNLSDFVQQQNSICDFSTSDSWVILSPIEQSIKRKIEAVGTPLKDWDINIYRGVLTGCNEAFIIDTAKRDEILANCKSDEERQRTSELIRPILRGRDIKRYGYDWANLWLIYIPWHFPYQFDESIQGASEKAEKAFMELYPAVYAHMLQYKEPLSNRNKAETGIRYEWYAMQRWGAKYWEDFLKPKIIFQEMVQESQFYFDTEGRFLCNDTCRIITGSHLPFLLLLLNSRLFFYAVKHFYGGGGLGENGVRMKHTFFQKFPCLSYDESFGLIIGTNDTEAVEQAICKRYNLNDEEMRIILDVF